MIFLTFDRWKGNMDTSLIFFVSCVMILHLLTSKFKFKVHNMMIIYILLLYKLKNGKWLANAHGWGI